MQREASFDNAEETDIEDKPGNETRTLPSLNLESKRQQSSGLRVVVENGLSRVSVIFVFLLEIQDGQRLP
jgi:hypothetical protein